MKLDRLTRSVRDLADLLDMFEDGKRSLLSVSEQIDTRSAAGRLVLNLLTSVASWEREVIGERTATAMQHMRAQGRYTGGAAPFGYVVEDGALVEVEAEQAVIREARLLRSSGLALRAIAKTLSARGMRSRSGRSFAPSAIATMVSAA